MNFTVDVKYVSCSSSAVDLPVSSWSEVKEWYIRWHTLFYSLDGETYHEIPLEDDGAVDRKRPTAVQITEEERYRCS